LLCILRPCSVCRSWGRVLSRGHHCFLGRRLFN
jgi:hypothetical protein